MKKVSEIDYDGVKEKGASMFDYFFGGDEKDNSENSESTKKTEKSDKKKASNSDNES